MKKKNIDTLTKLLIFFIVTNLGRFLTLINIRFQVYSFILLVAVIFLVINMHVENRPLYFDNCTILSVSMIFYLLFGTLGTSFSELFGQYYLIIKHILLLFVLKYSVQSTDNLDQILDAIIFSGLVLMFFFLLEYLQIFKIMSYVAIDTSLSYHRWRMMWLNPNTFGIVLVFVTIVNSHQNTGFRKQAYNIIFFIGIISTVSRSAVLLFIITQTIDFYFNNKNKNVFKKIIMTIFFALLFIGLFTIFLNLSKYDKRFARFLMSDQSNEDFSNGRIAALYNGLLGIKNNPLIGVGIKKVSELTTYTQSSHNMYVNIWAESGIIPFMLYIVFLLKLGIQLITRRDQHKTFYMQVNLFVFIIIFGIFAHTLFVNYVIGLAFFLINWEITEDAKEECYL